MWRAQPLTCCRQLSATQPGFEVAHNGRAITPLTLGLKVFNGQAFFVPWPGQLVDELRLQHPG